MLQMDASSLRTAGAPSFSGRAQLLPHHQSVPYRKLARDQRRHIATAAHRHLALAAALTASRCAQGSSHKQQANFHVDDSHYQRCYGTDVLGLAQAMVDYTAGVPYSMLAEAPFSVAKGSRRVISLQERAEIMERLDDAGCESEVSPGGSLANTLVAISRLSAAHRSHVRVAMSGCVGTDTLGTYFNAQLAQAGVRVLQDPDNPSHTGTVMVLTTPDAQRSFLSFFDSGSLFMTPTMAAAIRAARMVVIEGYMLELPGSATWVMQVAEMARHAGAHVVLTAGDPGVVQRHRGELTALLTGGLVDVLFCNKEEACELLDCCGSLPGAVPPAATISSLDPEAAAAAATAASRVCSAQQAAASLGGLVPVAVVTDGASGSHVCVLGELHSLGTAPTGPHGTVDVCGAGDAYAAGVLYAMTQGYDLRTAGEFAARVAAAVIGRHGAQLAEEDAAALVAALPTHVLLPQHWPASSSTLAA